MISNTFERHAQTALVLLLVALLLWVGSTTQETAVHIAEMKVEIENLKANLASPTPQFTATQRRLEEHAARLSNIEAALLKGNREQKDK